MHDGHGIGHHHHPGADEGNRSLAMLAYMLEHNRHHEGELLGLADALCNEGKTEAASLVREAAAEFSGGNIKLDAALKLLKGGE